MLGVDRTVSGSRSIRGNESVKQPASGSKPSHAGRLHGSASNTADTTPTVNSTAVQQITTPCAGAGRQYDMPKAMSLPPLRGSREVEGTAVATSSTTCSPTRRACKAELMAYAMGKNPTLTGSDSAGLVLDLEMQQLAATSHNHKEGRLLLETWLNDLLTSTQCHRANNAQSVAGQQQTLTPGLKGAAAVGLSRQQLLAAGLSHAAADQLYRSLYVYSVGFFDTVKGILADNEHRQELLLSIWRAFLHLAQHALKSNFKSDYLSLVDAAGAAMTELLCSKQALAEAHHENASMFKELSWLSAAEAEASSMRRGLKSQVEELQIDLVREQAAHQHAVQQYVDALDEKSAMRLQLQEAQRQLGALQASQELLQQQYQQLQGHYGTLLRQCTVVRNIFRQVDTALALDNEIVQQLPQPDHLQQLQPADPCLPENTSPRSLATAKGSGSTAEPASRPTTPKQHSLQPSTLTEAATETAEDLQPLAEKLQLQIQFMHAEWRSAADARAVALTDNNRMGDELREAKEAAYQAKQQLQQTQQEHQAIARQLEASQVTSTDLEQRLLAAHEAVAKHLLELGDAEGQLAHTQTKAATLENKCGQLEEYVRQLRDDVAGQQQANFKLEQQLRTSGERLLVKHRLMAEMSKGFAVSIQSLWQQQSARKLVLRLLTAEQAKGDHLGSSLEGKDARLHDLDATVQEQSGRITKMTTELGLLEASLADAQRQTMSLSGRLSLADAKNEDLLAHAQTQSEQLSEVTTRMNKTLTKAELLQGQLDKAHREIKDLKEAAQACERQLGEARLQGKTLTSEMERLSREKKDQADGFEARKARLELDVQRLTDEMAAAEVKLELIAADLAGERDRVGATIAVMERKRAKKRRWKAAYSGATAEVESLHKQLLSQHDKLKHLEGRLKRLETEMRLLGAGAGSTSGVRLPAAVTADANDDKPASAVVAVDLAAARRAHESAVADAGRLARACLRLDEQIEQLEVAKQQLLLKLATADITSAQVADVRSQVAPQVTELQKLRQQREAAETQRGEAAVRARAAEAALRDAHQQRLQQRQWVLEQQALQASDLINTAALAQLAAAEAAEAALQAQLNQQLAAFESAQADNAALSQRMSELQAGIEKFTVRITQLQSEKGEAEEKLQRSNTVINFLQVEISNLKSERERMKLTASDSEGRIAGLEAELEAAKQSVTSALKALEGKHQADKLMLEQRQLADRARAAQSAKAAEAAAAALKARIYQLQSSLEWMVTEAWALRQGTRQTCNRNNIGSSAAVVGAAADQDSNLSRRSTTGSSTSGNSKVSASLCDAGAGGAYGTAGIRWLYLHQESGPWPAARQALADVVVEADKQGCSLGAGLHRLAAAALALPMGLPGLSFTPDCLAVLIGELMLNKIIADTAADAAAAGGPADATAIRQQRTSTTGSQRASGTGAQRRSKSGAAGASGAASSANIGSAGDGIDTSAPESKNGAAVVAQWWSAKGRKDLEGCVHDYFMVRLGGNLAVEAHCSALVVSLRKAAPRSQRARLFGRCLGLLEPVVPTAGVGALLHFLAHLHSSCGPLTGEATEGSSYVMARTAIQLATQLLQPTLAPACEEVAALPSALIAAAGGSSDNVLEVNDSLELLLGAWLAQRNADQRQLEMLFKMVDGRGKGLIVRDEFAALLKQVCPSAADALSVQQLDLLFASALRASGAGCTTVTLCGCASALLDAGLVGCAAHLRRHPDITNRPPFSEYRLLEDSWHIVKPLLQDLLLALPKKTPALAPEVSGLLNVVKKLSDSLDASVPAAEVWHLYRKALGFYSHHGKYVAVAPPAPASGMLGGSLFSASGSGVTDGAADQSSINGAAAASRRPSSRASAAQGDGSSPADKDGLIFEHANFGSMAVAAAVNCAIYEQAEAQVPAEVRSQPAPGSSGTINGAGGALMTDAARPASAASGSSLTTTSMTASSRPMSAVAKAVGAAALVGRPGSPLQWPSSAAKGASGNLSSSSSRSVSRPDSPMLV